MSEIAIPKDGSAMDSMPADERGYPKGKATIEVAKAVKRPMGLSQNDWQEAISGAAELFRRSGGLDAPTRENLSKFCDLDDRALNILYRAGHEQFTQALILRGIIRRGKNLDERQVMTLAALSDITSPLDIRQKLNRLGVKWYEYQNWMKDPKFADQFRMIAEQTLEQATAPAMIGLAERAQFNDSSLKYMLQLTGRYDPTKTAPQDIRSFLNGVIEIIQRNVSDRDTLQRIGNELAFLVKANGGG
jgi:hypothetical protein